MRARGAVRTILSCLGAGIVIAAPGATAHADAQEASLSVAIVAPEASEMSAWTDLRVDVGNAADVAVQARVPLRLSAVGQVRTASAIGGTCVESSSVIECVVSLPASGSQSLAIPVRWNGPGLRQVTVDARLAAAQSGEEVMASAATSVSVYTLALEAIRTSPTIARAGRRLVATAMLVRSDTRLPILAHSLRCPAAITVLWRSRTLGFLRGVPTRRGAHLTCSWRLPSDARGRFALLGVFAESHRGGMITKYPFWRHIH
jgi:hypothetical protein